MKRIFLIILMGFAILGYSKNDENPCAKLNGNWIWEGSSKRIAGTTETLQTTGQSRSL